MSMLTNGGGLATLEQNRDVKGLLDKLEAIAMSTEGVDERVHHSNKQFPSFGIHSAGPK